MARQEAPPLASPSPKDLAGNVANLGPARTESPADMKARLDLEAAEARGVHLEHLGNRAPFPLKDGSGDFSPVGSSDLAAALARIEHLEAINRARDERQTTTVQEVISTTPARHLGQIMITNRMSEADLLTKFRAMRAGHIPFDQATRARTAARIYPEKGTKLAERYPGTTLPLDTEVTREDFSAKAWADFLESGDIIAIA